MSLMKCAYLLGLSVCLVSIFSSSVQVNKKNNLLFCLSQMVMSGFNVVMWIQGGWCPPPCSLMSRNITVNSVLSNVQTFDNIIYHVIVPPGDWPTHWLTDSLTHWLTDTLIDSLTDSLTDWLIDSLTHWFTHHHWEYFYLFIYLLKIY